MGQGKNVNLIASIQFDRHRISFAFYKLVVIANAWPKPDIKSRQYPRKS